MRCCPYCEILTSKVGAHRVLDPRNIIQPVPFPTTNKRWNGSVHAVLPVCIIHRFVGTFAKPC